MGRSSLANTITLLTDAALIDLGFYLGFRVRFGSAIPRANLRAFQDIAVYVSVFAFLVFWFLQAYSTSRRRGLEMAFDTGVAVAIVACGTMAITFFMREFTFPRSVFFISGALQFLMICVANHLVTAIAEAVQPRRKVVVITDGDNHVGFVDSLRAFLGKRHEVVRTVRGEDRESLAVAILDVDVVCVRASLPPDVRELVIAECLQADKEVLVVPEIYDIMLHRARVTQVDDLPVFEIGALSLSPAQRLIKRTCDLILGIVLLVVLSPLLLVIAIAIKASSVGPVFYRQKRVGQDERLFSVVKFRTMIDGAENSTGPVLATEDDPRITRVGRFLRTYRLDELPQLINIVRGEMSFVGPRPERPFFVDRFSRAIPGYRYRLKAKPGLTGLAQIAGKYATEPADKLRYDLYYLRNYSLLLDLEIILQTLRVAFTPGASKGLASHLAAATKADLDSRVES